MKLNYSQPKVHALLHGLHTGGTRVDQHDHRVGASSVRAFLEKTSGVERTAGRYSAKTRGTRRRWHVRFSNRSQVLSCTPSFSLILPSLSHRLPCFDALLSFFFQTSPQSNIDASTAQKERARKSRHQRQGMGGSCWSDTPRHCWFSSPKINYWFATKKIHYTNCHLRVECLSLHLLYLLPTPAANGRGGGDFGNHFIIHHLIFNKHHSSLLVNETFIIFHIHD